MISGQRRFQWRAIGGPKFGKTRVQTGLGAMGPAILPAFSPRLLGSDLAISYSICSCQVRALALGLSDLHECRLSKPVHLIQLL